MFGKGVPLVSVARSRPASALRWIRSGMSGTSMIAHDFDRVGAAVAPDEAHAPLVIDADTVLAGTITRQQFQPVGGRDAQIMQPDGGIEHSELAARDGGRVKGG